MEKYEGNSVELENKMGIIIVEKNIKCRLC